MAKKKTISKGSTKAAKKTKAEEILHFGEPARYTGEYATDFMPTRVSTFDKLIDILGQHPVDISRCGFFFVQEVFYSLVYKNNRPTTINSQDRIGIFRRKH